MSSVSVRFNSFLFFIRFSMNSRSYLRPDFVGWSVWMDSNHRPRAYQARALTTWATDRFSFGFDSSIVPFIRHRIRSVKSDFGLPTFIGWWRWWESNPWPPACRAGALPAELHPLVIKGLFFEDLWSPKIEQQKSPYKLRTDSSIPTPGYSWKHPMVSIERRWSSRTFRYGYLVTT